MDIAEVKRRYCVATKAFESNSHGLTSLHGTEVSWSQTPTGPACEDAADSRFTLPVDMAILALGYSAKADVVVVEQLGLKLDEHDAVVSHNSATSVKGVFVAGDVADGPGLVAAAIASGRDAAEKIDAYLRG